MIRAHHHCDEPRFVLLPVVVCEQWWRSCFSLLWPGEDQQTRQPCAFPAGDSSQPSALHWLSNERRSGAHGPPKEQIQKEMAAVPPFHLQVACQVVPAFFDASRPSPTLPSPAGKRTAGSYGLSTKMMVHVSRYAGTRVALGARKPPRFCLECRCRDCANPRVALLAAFSVLCPGATHCRTVLLCYACVVPMGPAAHI